MITSLGLVGVFVMASRLWRRPVAGLAALLLALDPFLVGHSGLLHLDGLLTTAVTLSALAMLLAVCPQTQGTSPYRWSVVSGLLAGMALLTKTPGGFLLPFTGALLLAAWLTRRIPWRQAAITMGLWVLTVGLTFLAFHPGLWVDPGNTLQSMFEVGGRHIEGAIRPVFFHGQITYEPRATFYPIVWLFRASPLVLIGLPVALVAHLRRPSLPRFYVIALISTAIGFGLIVTLVGKKHDRYLLPAIPSLTLVAALGWEKIGEIGVETRITKLTNSRTLSYWIIPTGLILMQLFFTLPYRLTPLGYFYRLLGGPRAALEWLPVSWDEGLGAAARWLNQRPDAEQMLVATPSVPPLASSFVGQTVLLSQNTLSQVDYVASPPWQGADRLVDKKENHALVYDNKVGGISYASVTRNPAPLEQAACLDTHARQRDLIVLDAKAALAHLYDGPTDLAVFADAPDPDLVSTRLDALVPGHERIWYVALPVASPITARHIQQQLSCRGQLVSASVVAGTSVTLIDLRGSHPCDTMGHTQNEKRFSDALAMTDALLSDAPVEWPNHVRLVVRWEALTQLSADYRVILHLKDEAGRMWVEGGQEIVDTDYRRPSAWLPGDWSDQTFQLALPPAIPPGRYAIDVGVFDPVSGVGFSAWDSDAAFAGLAIDAGTVTIAPPAKPPTPFEETIAQRYNPPVFFGPLSLLGTDPPPERIASGDRVSFDLLWQTITAPSADYSLRWKFISPIGKVALEKALPLSPYSTALWRDGELEKVRYDIKVPPELPATDYGLVINVLDAEDAPLWDIDYVLTRVEILACERLFSLPREIGYPLDSRLGSVVHLHGLDAGALSAQPGDHISLTLCWKADGPTELSYTVSVHLVGPDGMLHGQVDRPPANGVAPTHSWAPGQVIIDEIALPVLANTPPGTYQIMVGLYDQKSGVSLPAYDKTGAELPNRQITLPIEVTVE